MAREPTSKLRCASALIKNLRQALSLTVVEKSNRPFLLTPTLPSIPEDAAPTLPLHLFNLFQEYPRLLKVHGFRQAVPRSRCYVEWRLFKLFSDDAQTSPCSSYEEHGTYARTARRGPYGSIAIYYETEIRLRGPWKDKKSLWTSSLDHTARLGKLGVYGMGFIISSAGDGTALQTCAAFISRLSTLLRAC